MDAQRALLEELMRPHIPGSRKFTDKDVCKNMLVAFCPNELFTNTKSNLGHCNLFHDEMLQNDYRNSPDFQKLGYEQTFYAYLQQLVNDVERSIRRNKERLDVKPPLNEDEKQERMILLEEKIKALLNEMEKVGEEGKIDEATKLDAEAERLKQELEAVKLGLPGKYEKRMEVCDICGALLVMGDSKDRIESHMTGKQHTGFQLIRDTLEEHKVSLCSFRSCNNCIRKGVGC
ncbi:hypothetical protein BJ742DRAFT_826481 [Cladochytrium replicatum]|nr:hypothetical protein BJ742DRAFT_826481 [Cladochytrium replicatum]